MAYGSLYNDLIFPYVSDDPACFNFLSRKKFSEDEKFITTYLS